MWAKSIAIASYRSFPPATPYTALHYLSHSHAFPLVLIDSKKVSGSKLFHQHHLARCGVFACADGVEICPAYDLFIAFVPPIPWG